MLALLTPCEPPTRSIWHVISGVLSLAVLWAGVVVFAQWWMR